MKNTFFITGTDTDVGKTVVAAALLQAANQKGLACYGLKPLAAGAYQHEGVWRNQDADLLMQYSTVKLAYAQVNPVLLKSPKAPHLAAAEEGRKLDLNRLVGHCRGALTAKADFKIIEGAGGWRVPLNAREMLSDLPKVLNLPTILVVGMRLGCINHSILTAEAITRDGVTLAGWIANCVDPNMPSINENIATLEALLPVPLVGVIPWLSKMDIASVAGNLDLARIIRVD